MKKKLFILLLFCNSICFSQEEVKTLKKSYSWQPFATSGVTIERAVSFRLQAGMMKKWGFYVAGKTNFRFERPGEMGMEFFHFEDDDDYWKVKPFYKRWAVYAGPIVRLSSRWMIYWGIGYGKIFRLAETMSGERVYDDELCLFSDMSSTVEWDFGAMYSFKSFVLSTGFSLPAILILLPEAPAVNISLGYIFPTK